MICAVENLRVLKEMNENTMRWKTDAKKPTIVAYSVSDIRLRRSMVHKAPQEHRITTHLLPIGE